MSTFDQVCACIGATFRINPASLTAHDSQDSIAEWDSVGQIQLVLELESVFGISFSLEEILELRSIGDIVKLVESKRK